MNLLWKKGTRGAMGDSDAHLREVARKLEETLDSFGVKVTVNNVSCGPTVTRYELMPEQGVTVSRIVGLTDDIKLSFAAADVRALRHRSRENPQSESRFQIRRTRDAAIF